MQAYFDATEGGAYPSAAMLTIAPFKALRPDPALASRICELPYDVMSSEEARAVAANNPLSFLHVSKPEIDLPPGTLIYSDAVYAMGRTNFERLIAQAALRQDSEPHYYLYRQVMGAHTQTGLVAAASCEDYLQNRIKKHEFTRPDKEDDRVRHIQTLNSQTGPVFLVYRAVESVDQFLAARIEAEPVVDFTAPDGVRHSAWTVAAGEDERFITREFERMAALYIADGHHRCAAAARVFKKRNGAGESGRFLSVIFSHKQVRILPYNRVLKDLNGMTNQALLERLLNVFELVPGSASEPRSKGEAAFYMDRQWRMLRFRIDLTANARGIDGLDVELLQKHVLAPLFGITNPRTSERVKFVGGIRGTKELERLVDSGENSCAFSMFPTGIEELMEVADAGGVMPPKSTWFEPKLRDAMFCHML